MTGLFFSKLFRTDVFLHFSVLLLLGTTFLGSAVAQDDDQLETRFSAIFSPAPRDEIRKPLSDARRAIAEKEFDVAVDILGKLAVNSSILDKDEATVAEDYFVAPNRLSETLVSFRGEVMRLLGSLPATALKSHELKYGGEAQLMLREAVDKGDVAGIGNVSRTYFHTQAGYEATMMLGRYQMEQGYPQSAAALFKSVADSPIAQAKFEPEASVLAACAWHHAGNKAAAETILLDLQKRRPYFSVKLGSETVAAFRKPEEIGAWLERVCGAPGDLPLHFAPQWTMFRGSADRNAAADTDVPALHARWKAPLTTNPHDEQLLLEAARQYVQKEVAVVPSMQSLAVGNLVLFRGPQRLWAIDVPSGRRVWEYPWDDESSRPGREVAGDSVRSLHLRQRVWDDAPYGQLSSDGRNVYLIERIGYTQAYGGAAPALIGRGGFAIDNSDQMDKSNVLTALDLSSQGKIRWRIEPDPKAPHDDPLREIFFLGPPLPTAGLLFAMAEIDGQICLLALAPDTGKPVWRQQLSQVEESPIDRDPMRRLGGAIPSASGGVLVCPTGGGAIVAVDSTQRRLLWGFTYRKRVQYRSGVVSGRGSRVMERWADGSVTLADDRALVGPIDAESLYCLKLSTGEKLWEHPREESMFVVGVRNGIAILVGRSEVLGLKIADGTSAWAQPFDLDTAMPSGRGILTADELHLPTTDGRLLVINAVDGKLKRSQVTDGALGNLVAYNDDLFSLSPRGMAAYHRLDRLTKRIEERLAKNPADSWALARKGEMLAAADKQEEALAVLRRAAFGANAVPSARAALVDVMLKLLEADYTKHAALQGELERLLDDAESKNRFYRVLALGREKAGERVEAFLAFLEIDPPSTTGFAQPTGAQGARWELDATHSVRKSRFLAAHLRHLYEEASDAERLGMDKLIQEKRNRLSLASPADLRWFLDRFDFHAAADPVRLQLARLVSDAENYLDAEFQLLELVDASPSAAGARATFDMARLLDQSRRESESLVYLARLRDRFGGIDLGDGKKGIDAFAQLTPGGKFDRLRSSYQPTYPLGKTTVETLKSEIEGGLAEGRRLLPIAVIQADHLAGSEWTVHYDSTQNSVRVRDGRGSLVGVVGLNRPDRRYHPDTNTSTARIYGHLLIFSTGYEVIAIDLLQAANDPSEAILWRSEFVDAADQQGYLIRLSRPVPSPWTRTRHVSVDSAKRLRGVISPITSHGLCFMKQNRLVCVDPLTGETQWQRDGLEPGSDLFGDEELLFSVPHGAEQADVYRMLDGEKIGRRAVAKFDNRWTTFGRNVLAWKQIEKSVELTLTDAWTGREIWKEAAPLGSQACLCGVDEVAVVHLDGTFRIRSLSGSDVRVEAKFAPEPSLQQIHVVRGPDNYMVAVAVATVNPIPQVTVQSLPNGNHVPLISGRIHAFDRGTGKPLWQSPAAVSQIGLPLDQPVEQPALLFMRNVNPTNSSENRRSYSSILCLDKRTGAAILNLPEAPMQNGGYEMEAERDSATIRIGLPSHTYRLKFTEEPTPPAPPAQLDSGFLGSRGPGEAVGRALFRAFGPKEEPEEADPFAP